MQSTQETAASTKFGKSYLATFGAVLAQLVATPIIRKNLTVTALTLAASVALSMTAGVQESHASDNNVVRAAKDTLGAVIGGAIGAQFGKGSGRKAATVAGAAAGVWAAEALSEDPQPGQQPSYSSYPSTTSGPVMPRDWNAPAVYHNSVSAPRTASRLASGTIALAPDRAAKISARERSFLRARDTFAATQYAAQQTQDDAVLEPHNKTIQQHNAGAAGQMRQAGTRYDTARREFVETVEYFGKRGYDVKDFAYSHRMAYEQVTANDMARRDMTRATEAHFATDEQDYQETPHVRY